MTSRHYGTIGIVGVGAFLLALVALHVLDSDLSVVDEYISEYALGDYGLLSRAADFALGVGVIAIALGLRKRLASGKRVTASWVLILIAGLGFIVSGIFVTDPTGTTESTVAGTIHDIAGYVSILGLVVSAWMLPGVFARDDTLAHLARTQLWLAIVVTVAFLAMFLLFELSVGLPQRVFVAVILSWLLVVAVNIQRT